MAIQPGTRLKRGVIRLSIRWAVTFVSLAALPLSAQVSPPATVSPAIAKFIQQTTARVAKTHKQKILLAPRASCFLDEQHCMEVDSLLRASLAKAIPGVQLLGHDDIVPVVKTWGLLTIDSYIRVVLEFYARGAGADILLTESLVAESPAAQKRGRDLWIRMYDTSSRKQVAILKSKDIRPLPVPGDDPVILQDAASGVSMVVPRGPRTYPDTREPECDYCPSYSFDPHSPPWAGTVAILGTVNTDGKIIDARVLQGLGTEEADAVLRVRMLERYKPAIGVDGKPFPVRLVFLTTFADDYDDY